MSASVTALAQGVHHTDLQRALATRVREHVIRMAGRGGCFIGSALSCVDLLVHLYTRVLHVSPTAPTRPDRDLLFLSKGHAVPALYGTLAELGFFPAERLEHHLRSDDVVYWHPNRGVPGVDFHAGSLGHLLPLAVGVAIDLRLGAGHGRVFVIAGDGELNEGSMWEAILVAAAQRLDWLVLVVDRNGLQANQSTEHLVPLEPLPEKLAAFGWAVQELDGHDFDALDAACAQLPIVSGRPTALIARTVRGRGVPSLENRSDRWFAELRPSEVETLLAELHGRPGPARGPALVERTR
jgi:transketolase